MMLSVIIPTYGRQQQVNKAVASILSQNYPCEIIVVDDGSDVAISISEIADPNYQIKIIRHKHNLGPASARNSGINAATMPLISFLDSDDEMSPDTLEKRVEFAIENGLMETGNRLKITGCGWQEVSFRNTITRKRIPHSANTPQEFFSGCWFCPGSAIIANRETFTQKDGEFDSNLRRLEDLDRFIRFGLSGGAFIPQALVGLSIRQSDSRHPDLIRRNSGLIWKKYHAMQNLPKNCLARLEAYLLYEEAGLLKSESRYISMGVALIKSLIKSPRLKLYPGPGWKS